MGKETAFSSCLFVYEKHNLGLEETCLQGSEQVGV